MNRFYFGGPLFLLLFAILAMVRVEVSAQTAPSSAVEPPQSDQQKEDQAKKEQANKGDTKSEEKKGEWVVAPIPISSPAVGTGLEWAVARLFPLSKKDKVSPPSVVGVGGLFTNNGSRAIAVGTRLYLKEDKYRLVAAFGRAGINADIYGVGEAAGQRGTYVPIKVDGGGLVLESLFRLKKGIYVGARGQYRSLSLSIDREKLDSPDDKPQPPQQIADAIKEIAGSVGSQKTASIGPRFQLDTRDSVFYPKRGVFSDVFVDLFSKGLGSKFTYQYYKFGFNKYNKLSEHQVLAFRGMGCAAAGDRVPIYDLCLFGTMNDLRGYAAGRFQDRRMFATQAEYRLMFPSKGFLGRFGVVAFGGVGAVAARFSDIGSDDLLPAGGGGVRFRMTKKQPINFRIDYGFGKVGNTLSVGVLEAF